METKESRIVFYSDWDFSLEVGSYGGNLFLHCNVNRWSASVLKRLYLEFARLRIEFSGETLFTVSPNPKFVQLFAGTYVSTIHKDGVIYEVYKWD